MNTVNLENKSSYYGDYGTLKKKMGENTKFVTENIAVCGQLLSSILLHVVEWITIINYFITYFSTQLKMNYSRIKQHKKKCCDVFN